MLSEAMNVGKLEGEFKKYLKEVLLQYAKPYSLDAPNYWLIIGACMPKNNILLDCKKDQYFPAKLQSTIDATWQIKWLLKEKDIKIDIVKFNEACISLFNKMFKNQENVQRLLGKNWTNVFFVQHSRLDCYSMFKTLKAIYGRSNCINVWKDKMQNVKLPLVALNDLIDRYVQNKTCLNSMQEFKNAVKEVKQYVDSCLLRSSYV